MLTEALKSMDSLYKVAEHVLEQARLSVKMEQMTLKVSFNLEISEIMIYDLVVGWSLVLQSLSYLDLIAQM